MKIDADRVNIKDCYEDVVDGGNTNPSVADCGYLLEFDDAMDEVNCFRTNRGLPVMFKDEVPKDGTLFNAVKRKLKPLSSIWKTATIRKHTSSWTSNPSSTTSLYRN